MSFDSKRVRQLLKESGFDRLFTEELGWDRCDAQLAVESGGRQWVLEAIAQKRGMVAYLCAQHGSERMPDYNERRKIERDAAKSAHEHILVFVDQARTRQIWQWVKRAPGAPAAYREHHFHTSQTGEALTQKLKSIAFSIDEEETLTLVDVTHRARAGFDVEHVTKRFYDQFRKEHAAFVGLIGGIDDDHHREWYASVMLNRLMFTYFMQRKGFLDGDSDYMRSLLQKCKDEREGGETGSFYRSFLLPLFHDGLGGRESSQELVQRLGTVPYLNGGIFELHDVEEHYPAIRIPDKAFERLFDYFDQYQWHLDERPLRADNEINPDVLGYIFEKYINQKQMGAYYTGEDITEYIAKSSIVPVVFARATAEASRGQSSEIDVWGDLRGCDGEYVFEELRHGCAEQLPPEVQAGMDVSEPGLLDRRACWNDPAPSEYALAGETWRDVVYRRARFHRVHSALEEGRVRRFRDFVTYNLDIRRFAEDAVENCDDPELLHSLWRSLESLTILDPTCGSGAFLFAALNILEPLYEACLGRMRSFVGDVDLGVAQETERSVSDFRRVLERVDKHSSERYYILKSIMLRNLFGVDIMEEAVEVCKLRLFLKLVAQIEPDTSQENLGVEPLPDVEFNVKSGNSLIGYASYEAAERAVTEKLDFDGTIDRIAAASAEVQKAYSAFRLRQLDPTQLPHEGEKLAIRTKLGELHGGLNGHLAREHGVPPEQGEEYSEWIQRHQPFHWFSEFHGIVSSGGFDVIIGNPPYLEARQVDYGLGESEVARTGAVHAACIERAGQLVHPEGCLSMIVPMALTSTQRMEVVQRLLERDRDVWYSNFAWRPGKLFDAVNRALTIVVAIASEEERVFTTCYQKWTSESRLGLFRRVAYQEVPHNRPSYWVPKLGTGLEHSILEKLLAIRSTIARFTATSSHRIYYRTTGGLYWKVFTDFPPAFRVNGAPGHSSRETSFSVADADHVKPLIGILSSGLFWWWYTVTSNLRDLNPTDVQSFPVPESALSDPRLIELSERYLDDIVFNSTMLIREQKRTGTTETQSFKIRDSKCILDEIDATLAPHYGLSVEELDLIVSYDIGFRTG